MHIDNDDESYGIVIDAGSSGSRVHIYKWQSGERVDLDNAQLARSVPQIIQSEDWTFKTTPGLSSFEKKPEKAFKKHVKPLLQYAEKVIPKAKLHKTPVFLQATAGMRLLPKKKQAQILNNVCKGLKQTDFLIEDCETQIQIIDGETEGIYGWISLNYLLGNFNDYDTSNNKHPTLGFMDMGGASTQIAFSPSDPAQIRNHDDDVSKVYLKSSNGDIQKWNVFVSTWLGFGANQARQRYFAQLVNSLIENTNNLDEDDYKTRKLTDPCTPRGYETKFEFKDKKFTAVGSGNNEQCLRMIYPLLQKNLPCEDEPCLFNGVHAPQIDYVNDKFVGVSEYWYTANDVFNLGGEYNFENFSAAVKSFCNSDWSTIKSNSKNGQYNSIPESYLAASCFKANWVLNVLHEGFGLPRLDVDKTEKFGNSLEHPLFQSAHKINEKELSWTLGRILLYACGNIALGKNVDAKIGIEPSPNAVSKLGKKFISGGIVASGRGGGYSWSISYYIFLCMLIFTLVWAILHKKVSHFNILPAKSDASKYFDLFKLKVSKLRLYTAMMDKYSKLEEGLIVGATLNNLRRPDNLSSRSKSMTNMNIPTNINDKSSSRPRSKGAPAGQGSTQAIPSTFAEQSRLRTTFSLADFSKYKVNKSYD